MPYQILKRGSIEKFDDFLKILEKTSKKPLINACKRKLCMDKSDPTTVVISTLGNSRKKGLPISILEREISTPATQLVDVTIMGADAY